MGKTKNGLYPCDDDDCDNWFKQYRSTDKYCSLGCAAKNAKPKTVKISNPIANFSKKRIIQNLQYNSDIIIFLAKPENTICPIKGIPTTDVHHKKGRIGFADDWARDNKIPLLLDQRFWVALSREGHKFVEEHPDWAKENGFSLNRLS